MTTERTAHSALGGRLIRYADLIPCRNAFVDSRSPGSDAKENFTLIGPGVSENPAQHVHIPEPHGFNIGGARQPGGCLNSQHSHDTAEVFVVHTGNWRFFFGPDRQDGHVDLGPGDVVSMSIHMFRGFEKTDAGAGFLFAVLGGDNPGRVTWAPSVFALAERYGLRLLKGGRLIDTTAGETVPEGATLETPPTAEEIARLATPPAEKLAACVARAAALRANPASALSGPGVEECPVITPARTADGFEPGPIAGWWPHGFNLRALRLASGARTAPHVRSEAEVLFVQSGVLEVASLDGAVVLGPGDTLTVPRGLPRAFRASSSQPALAYVVRGGDSPAAPRFVDAAAA